MKSLPPWDARNRRLPAQVIRRAIDPETNRPFPPLGPVQKLKRRVMKDILQKLITTWLPRQLIKLIAPVATAIGATTESTDQVIAFIVAGAAFLLDLVLSKLSAKWIKQSG